MPSKQSNWRDKMVSKEEAQGRLSQYIRAMIIWCCLLAGTFITGGVLAGLGLFDYSPAVKGSILLLLAALGIYNVALPLCNKLNGNLRTALEELTDQINPIRNQGTFDAIVNGLLENGIAGAIEVRYPKIVLPMLFACEPRPNLLTYWSCLK